MDNLITEKSQIRSKTIRKLRREEMFERSRRLSNEAQTNYLSSYPQQIQNQIIASMNSSIPQQIYNIVKQSPHSNLCSNPAIYQHITRQNISYFRRLGKPLFKTKMQGQANIDLHMTFESLWGLAGIDDIQSYGNYQKIIKQFEDSLGLYISIPYKQIRQMAMIAAGNKILGRQQDIINIVNSDRNQLWILINHIYQRKIGYTVMYSYLLNNTPIIYKTVYEMTNNQKDQIIESILKNEKVFEVIVSRLSLFTIEDDNYLYSCGFTKVDETVANKIQCLQICSYSVMILGNILAEKDDHCEQFQKYSVLEKLENLLNIVVINRNDERDSRYNHLKQNIKKDIFWFLSNYISEASQVSQIFAKPKMLQSIIHEFVNQTTLSIKKQIYYFLSCLFYYGDNYKLYNLALQKNLLTQFCIDMQIQDQQIVFVVLNIIDKLIQLSEDCGQNNSYNQTNPIIYFIQYSKLKNYIKNKTYSQNENISNVSFSIMDKVEQYEEKFGNIDQDM